MARTKKTLKNFGLRLLRLGFDTGASISSSLAASFVYGGDVNSAALLTGLTATCLAGRSSAEHYAKSGSTRQLEEELCDLQLELGGLREVVEALASGAVTAPRFSRDNAQALLSLVQTDVADTKELSEQHNEILFTMVRWLEARQEENAEVFNHLQHSILATGDVIRSDVLALASAQDEAARVNLAAHADTKRLIDSISERLTSQEPTHGSIVSFPSPDEVGEYTGTHAFFDMLNLEPVAASRCFRTTAIRSLDNVWRNRAKSIVTVVGAPGTGKSTLLHYWLGRLAKEADTKQRILAWTFQADGSHGRGSPDVFFERAFGHFGCSPRDIPLSTTARGERLARLLQKDATILILDGFELFQASSDGEQGRIQEPGLAALIRLLIGNNPGLCVLTTTQPVVDCAPFLRTRVKLIELRGLTPTNGAKMLQSLGVMGPQRELRLASEEIQGNPMALELLAGYLVELLQGDVRRRAEVRLLEQDAEHGGKAASLMAAYEKQLSGTVELAVLRTLAVFDRPAASGDLAAITRLPVVPGLNEHCDSGQPTAWTRAIARLQRTRLVETRGSGAGQRLSLNTLAREYFRCRLREGAPAAWREGNLRLYRHFVRAVPAKPRTIHELLPCINAVVYGCRAGRAVEALDAVFVPRIRQSDQHFSTHRLGAWSTDLIALSEFFEVPWVLPRSGLDAKQKAYVLKEAGFSLWALGWLGQAVTPLQTALAAYDSNHQDEQVARVAGNLSAIHADLGQLAVAERYASTAVIAADKSGVFQQRITRRASLAHVLHQMGRMSDAADLFKKSEELQAEEQPQSPRLYARSGYQYWEFLLDQAELLMPTAGDQARHIIETVRQRARESLALLEEEKLRSPTLSDLALCHLTLGRVGVLKSNLGDSCDDRATRQHLNKAVTTFQDVGVGHWLPAALIARATCHRTASRWKDADGDICQALSLSQAHEMHLQEADAYLEAARLCFAQDMRAQSREHIVTAQGIVGSCGYRRRDGFLASLLAEIESTSA